MARGGRHRLFNFDRRPISWKTVAANVGLILLGDLVYVLGLNGILVPNRFLSGGTTGIALIIHYLVPWLNLGLLFFLANIPLMLIGWFLISRRFMYYTLFGMTSFSLMAAFIKTPALPVDDPMLAALCAAVICGAGSGIILRSHGSGGGFDILAVFFHKNFGLRQGLVVSGANILIILVGAGFFGIEIALYTIVYLYGAGRVVDALISGFNRRKSIFIISDKWEQIARDIFTRVNRGVTYLKGEGAYTGTEKKVIFTITTMTELPKLKDVVFDADPDAFVVINDTLEVLGKRHGSRRIY